jgi:hypothetical protein
MISLLQFSSKTFLSNQLRQWCILSDYWTMYFPSSHFPRSKVFKVSIESYQTNQTILTFYFSFFIRMHPFFNFLENFIVFVTQNLSDFKIKEKFSKESLSMFSIVSNSEYIKFKQNYTSILPIHSLWIFDTNLKCSLW